MIKKKLEKVGGLFVVSIVLIVLYFLYGHMCVQKTSHIYDRRV